MFGWIADVVNQVMAGRKAPVQEVEKAEPPPIKEPYVLRVTLKNGTIVDFTEEEPGKNLLYRADNCGSLTIFQTWANPYAVGEKKLCTYAPGSWELVHPRDNKQVSLIEN